MNENRQNGGEDVADDAQPSAENLPGSPERRPDTGGNEPKPFVDLVLILLLNDPVASGLVAGNWEAVGVVLGLVRREAQYGDEVDVCVVEGDEPDGEVLGDACVENVVRLVESCKVVVGRKAVSLSIDSPRGNSKRSKLKMGDAAREIIHTRRVY